MQAEIKILESKTQLINVIHFIDNESYLSKNQAKRWKDICQNVAIENHVYIEAGLKHLEEVVDIYNNWIKEAQEVTEKNAKNKSAPVLNKQGMLTMGDFPVVQIIFQIDKVDEVVSKVDTKDW